MFFFNGYEWDLQNPKYIYILKNILHMGMLLLQLKELNGWRGVTQKVRDISPTQKWTILW